MRCSAVLALVGVLALSAGAYTIAQYYGPSWSGAGAPDVIVNNTSNGCLPMANGDCPSDPGLADRTHYGSIIFDGEIIGKRTASSEVHTGQVLVIDWTHSSGWLTAQIAADLHWQELYSVTGSLTSPDMVVVFWIKGEVGAEQSFFSMALSHADGEYSRSQYGFRIVTVTTEWQQVAIPVNDFFQGVVKPVHGLRLSQAGRGSMVIYLDQIYLTTSVAPTTSLIGRSVRSMTRKDFTPIHRILLEETPLNGTAIIDPTGRMIKGGAMNATAPGLFTIIPEGAK